MKKITYFYALLFAMLIGGGWTNFAWAIDWKQYDSKLISGQKYLMYSENTKGSYSTNHFLRHPTVEWGATDPATSKTVTGSNFVKYFVTTAHAEATWFTLESTGAVSTYTIKYKKNYNDAGESWKYITHQWGKTSGINNTWNTTSTDIWVLDSYTKSSVTYPNGLKYNDYATPTAGTQNTNDKYFYIQTVSGPTSKLGNAGGSTPLNFLTWTFICEEAYADATASNQFYYTVAAQAYTNGAASTDGGTVGIVPKTYQKPDVTDWAAGDYGESIAESKKGSNTSSATVTFFAKIGVSSESYNFAGFTDGDGNALTESETIAPNNYYEVDVVNHIYRVTIAVNGTDANPTDYILRACYASASEPVVNVYNTNDEVTGYGTLAAALDAAASGYRVELLADIENVSSTITINKDITLDFNGHSISGSATNLVTVSGNVTFVDNLSGTPGGVTTTGATAVLVSGGSLTINDGNYQGETYALQHTGGSVTINSGGFQGGTQDVNGTVTLKGGFFNNKNGLSVQEGYAVVSDIPTGMKYSGYSYMVVKKTSENYPLCVLISELENNPTIRLNFNSLEKAIAYANNNTTDGRTKTILLKEDYTLPAGNYTIPTQTTLVIPYSAEQTSAKPHIDRTLGDAVPSEAYRTLTLADGVHIDVFGAIEVGGQQTGGTATSTSLARPGGDTYGLMQMNSGSSITLYENANFYAWGFVTGEGTMDMRRGAVVREQFQINDWKTLGPTCQMAAGSSINYQLHVLPINQYFIQNIEVKTTYRPGSRLLGQVCAYVVGYNLAFNDVGIIGVKYSAAEKAADPTLEDDVAIFLMDNEDDSEDTWVRKSYDVAHDTQLYEVNNSAYLGSLKMYVDLKGTPVNLSTYGYGTQDHLNVDSKDFVLPLTNNFKIHLLYGNLYATQNTVLLPGAEIEVNKKSTLTINANQTLSLYDANQWGQYTVVGVTDGDLDFGYATRIKCRPGGVPTVRDISSAAGLGDAMLNVHGSVDVKGYLKTTTGDKKASNIKSEGTYTFSYEDVTTPLDGGAAVVSTIADAGTITFSKTAPSVSDGTNKGHYLWQVTGPMSTTNDVRYVGDHEIPALLTNEDDSFAPTASTAAGTSFCFIDFNGDGKGEWKSLTTDGCFVKDEKEVYYAKPQDYVALANGKTSNNNHTYSAVDGRTLILVDDCQWWEVEPVENRPDLFHCTHPQNDMYYYWDGTKWTEKRYTVTWNDWDGEEYGTYSLKYGVQPKYLGNIPIRDKDAYYTYDFIGWSPEITESTIVTEDITYTAQFARTDRMYTVTWQDEGGNVIETGYFKMGELPVCESAPDMTNKEWNPAVSAVTGNTTYTLQTKAVKDNYTITWKNWDGTTLQTTTPAATTSAENVLAGYTVATPTKPALGDIEFTFKAWSPTVTAATADAIYTATFTENPITYTITWKNDDGTTLGTSEVTPNTVPQYNGTPARSSDAENYFFAGWTPDLAAATEDATYTATYTSKNLIVDGETYEVPESENVAITNLIIRNDGIMDIPASSTFNVNTLTLESDGTNSGQIIGAARLYLTGDAIFRLEKSFDARTWYAVAVPWTVDIKKGVYAGGKRLSAGEFFVIEFDATAYASADRETGTYWNFLDETGKDMQPGKLYMIWLKSAQSAIEFHKTSGNLLTTSTTLSPAAGSIPGQSHWNAIANPALFHANLATGAAGEDVLKYNGDDAYIVGSTTNMIVGEPMFVQTATSASVTATRYTGAGMPAYHRAPQTNADNRFVLELTKENQLADRLIVQTAEEKANEYVIGKDLSKMGVSSKVAQMWIERYDAQLCKNTIELPGEQAEYPLSLFAPAAGEYVLSASQERGESVLYLTRNGQPVWNLSYGECVLNVEEGTTNEYGLRIVSSKAPQTATGVGNVQSDGVQCTKELRDGVIYILRGEKVYTIDGQLVK